MITYTYQKPIAEITDSDQSFTLDFTDGVLPHMDSVVIPRNLDNTVDIANLEIAIANLVEYVKNKFGDNFNKN